MANKKKSESKVAPTAEVEEETIELNQELVDDFTNEMEVAINKVCISHKDEDPRFELLITLANLATQVAVQSGFTKEEFLTMLDNMYDDFVTMEENGEDGIEVALDKLKIN